MSDDQRRLTALDYYLNHAIAAGTRSEAPTKHCGTGPPKPKPPYVGC